MMPAISVLSSAKRRHARRLRAGADEARQIGVGDRVAEFPAAKVDAADRVALSAVTRDASRRVQAGAVRDVDVRILGIVQLPAPRRCRGAVRVPARTRPPSPLTRSTRALSKDGFASSAPGCADTIRPLRSGCQSQQDQRRDRGGGSQGEIGFRTETRRHGGQTESIASSQPNSGGGPASGRGTGEGTHTKTSALITSRVAFVSCAFPLPSARVARGPTRYGVRRDRLTPSDLRDSVTPCESSPDLRDLWF
jgi:hypothetical protein